jgi:hypothetical protein
LSIAWLRGSVADIGPYTGYTNTYGNACQNFKSAFRSGAANYTVKRWVSATSSINNTADMISSYTIPAGTGTQAATVCQLGKIVPGNLTGIAQNYYVSVDVLYNLPDAAGNIIPVLAKGITVSSFTINAEAALTVRSTDTCPVYKSFSSGSVATNRSVCGTNRYEWRIRPTVINNEPSVSLNSDILGAVGGSRILPMTSFPAIGSGNTYDVKIRSLHADGVSVSNPWSQNSVSGSCVRTLGSAGMPTVEDGGVIAERSENGVTTSIYPNPNNGQSVNFAVSGMDGEMNVRIADATGRMVYANRYMVEGSMNTTIDFGQTLAGGVYMVEMIQNGEMKTMRMVVSK